MSKFVQFFATEAGQSVALGTIIFSAVATFSAKLLPHSFGVHKYKEFVQAYK
jgi:hypothetical protein